MYQTIILNFENGNVEKINHKEKSFEETKNFENYNLSNIEFMTKKGEYKIK